MGPAPKQISIRRRRAMTRLQKVAVARRIKRSSGLGGAESRRWG
jgi:hypothetical protein